MQLPFPPGTPWIGGTFGADLPRGEWLSLVVLDASALAEPVLQCGLMIDDWTETVPADRETTGVAFNFNRPNAIAPQALLVAVPPVLRGHWELGRSGRLRQRERSISPRCARSSPTSCSIASAARARRTATISRRCRRSCPSSANARFATCDLAATRRRVLAKLD